MAWGSVLTAVEFLTTVDGVEATEPRTFLTEETIETTGVGSPSVVALTMLSLKNCLKSNGDWISKIREEAATAARSEASPREGTSLREAARSVLARECPGSLRAAVTMRSRKSGIGGVTEAQSAISRSSRSSSSDQREQVGHEVLCSRSFDSTPEGIDSRERADWPMWF